MDGINTPYNQILELYDLTRTSISKLDVSGLVNHESQEAIVEALTSLSQLIEKTFTHYEFKFFLEKDYFSLFVRIYPILRDSHPEHLWRLFQLSQLIISNTKTAEDLDDVFKLEGFHAFFNESHDFNQHDEIVDYFINIMKSIVLRLNDQSDFRSIEVLVMKVLGLLNHKDNLVRTTVRNIILSLLRLENKRCQEFLSSHAFLYYLVAIVRDVQNRISQIDHSILEDKAAVLKEEILNLQDNIQYIEEIIQCSSTPRLKALIKNCFIVGIVFQVVLPVFRPDVNVQADRLTGINTILLLVNNILSIMNKSGLSVLVAENVIINDNVRTDNKKLFDYRLFHFSSPEELESSDLVGIIGNSELFSQSKSGGQKFLKMLLAFLKSKDDNMLLLTLSIVLYMLESGLWTPDPTDLNYLADKSIELLSLDPSFRLVTCQYLAKTIYLCFSLFKLKQDQLLQKIVQTLKTKVSNLVKAFGVPSLRDLLISKFRTVIYSYDEAEKWKQIHFVLLGWLSVYNYNFNQGKSKDLRYLSLDYKYELIDEEYIEIEIKLFILLKQLRYQFIQDTILIEYEKDLKAAYITNFSQTDNPSFVEGNDVIVDFNNETICKKLFSGFAVDKDKNPLVLALFGRELMLLEELDKHNSVYRIKFREYYTDVVYYFDRSNPRQLNFTLAQKVKFWGFLFSNNQWCIKAKNFLNDIVEELKNKEADFIYYLLKKYQADNIN